ncbi:MULTISPECIES: pitrilysin family protein [unclassified Mesobacillus]|uniref:EF-P 5-aminopentanol modification-associated protein YfmF n=1 Tax=unclassified Mesobacillus TaxID=2675270 RepID=UPI0020419ED1|nr:MULTISPECIES: pitrilysin family protein [unclassified Mesobacillus]MCM3123244.1 insulinase family protein [Mesobacillus sp. MER 33]MCM3233273.1 insulinase family protein [Mesobacillus sp. MER 48]
MAVISETIKDMKGYKLHIVKTAKFKTNTIVWKMKTPLTSENVTKRALLPYVLQSSSKAYETTSKLRSYLDELYGANLYVDVSKKGEYQVISFSLEIANEKFLSDPEPLLKKGMELIAEILVNPLAENDAFDKETVEKEKRTLKQRIQAVYDDKMRYSNFRLVQEMCKGEPYALHVNGEIDDIPQINEGNLYEYYKQAFAEDEMDLYIIGDVNEDEVHSTADELLQFEDRVPVKVETHHAGSIEEKTVKDQEDVKQGKLNIGYRTNVLYGDQEYYALQVFNGIFGGFSHSKLFLNVREKNSLAYYVASRLESHKGLMMVMSGIEFENFELAVKIIREQMEAMQAGDFTDQEVEQTKAVIENQMLETMDTARGMVEVLYHNVVSDQNVSLDDWLQGMSKTTKEEIVDVAKKVQLDTVYFLTGLEADK